MAVTKNFLFAVIAILMGALFLPSAGSQAVALDNPIPAAAEPGVQIAMGADDRPRVLYGPNVSDVHLLQCGDALCRVGNTSRFVTGSQRAYTSELIVADDGRSLMTASTWDGPNSSAVETTVCLQEQCVRSPRLGTLIATAPNGDVVVGGSAFNYETGESTFTISRCQDSFCASHEELYQTTAKGLVLRETGEVVNDDDVASFRGTAMAVGPSGAPVIAYTLGYDTDPGTEGYLARFYVARCTSPTCIDLETIVEIPEDVTPAALRVDAQGLVTAVYTEYVPLDDGSGGRRAHRRVLRCLDPSCEETTDFVVADAEFSAVEFDGDGFPAFASATEGGAVALIRCTDVSCATEPIRTVAAGDRADYSGVGLTFDAEGLPAMAYVNGQGHLVVRRCVQAGCDGPRQCDGLAVTIDLNEGASGIGTPGNDVILGTPGADFIDAGAGDDVVCAGEGHDEIVGGSGDDVLFGEGGRDAIRANQGDDFVDGGTGDDVLQGGIGNDVMYGRAGRDFLGGFGGHDEIYGGLGDDTIFGGYGRDMLFGDNGDDIIHGLIGDDTIFGGGGEDELHGDQGNDVVDGGYGADYLSGGGGNDVLLGDYGADLLLGGRADDTLDGGPDLDTCSGNKHVAGDTSINCETIYSVP